MRLNLPIDQDVTDATAGTLLLVSAAVLVGQVEGRPMNVSKLAHYVRLPRTTVLRKLELLIELGLVVRRGQNYCLSDERAKTISLEYLKRAKKIIRDAAHELA
jgi:DNA-binding IclR family transcriptional regulator